MLFKEILKFASISFFLVMTGCGGSSSANVVNDAIKATDTKCPLTDSEMFGQIPGYANQKRVAIFYVDSVFRSKSVALNEKYESKGISESTIKKYNEERSRLDDSKKNAKNQIDSIYQTKIDNELSARFSSGVSVPLNLSELNPVGIKSMGCYLSYNYAGGLTLELTATALPAGYSEGYAINGKMNFLCRPTFYLQAYDKEDNKLDFRLTVSFRGSDTDTFVYKTTISPADIAQLGNFAYFKVTQ